MDKLNKTIIQKKKKVEKIKKKITSLQKQKQHIYDSVHLDLDSSLLDTSEAEEFIINYYWQNATYSSAFNTSTLKQSYIKAKLTKFTKKFCKNRLRAIDIGCGNGIYTEHLATLFDDVIGLDLSKKRIEKNKKKNTFENITYLDENFFTCKKSILGKFDFVFATDLGMYSVEKYHKSTFFALLDLLKDDGVLITRESTSMQGERSYKSINYVAYYRNKNYYKKRFYKPYFLKFYRDSSYNIKELKKFFNTFPKKYNKLKSKPLKLDKYVNSYVPKEAPSSHFYIYSKRKSL